MKPTLILGLLGRQICRRKQTALWYEYGITRKWHLVLALRVCQILIDKSIRTMGRHLFSICFEPDAELSNEVVGASL